ncbi:MAG: hypothetical protein FWB95_08840 [Treponema sp.]|nr:hypothetical protein [Treponema sp.]
MKNTKELIGLIAIIAIIGLSFTACDKDKGGGSIKTNFKFHNAVPPANLNVQNNVRVIMGGTEKDTDSFTSLEHYYTTLGTYVASFTPAKFAVGVDSISVYAPTLGGYVNLLSDYENIVDFAQGVTLNFPENLLEPGDIISTVILWFNLKPGSNIKFDLGKPANIYNAFPTTEGHNVDTGYWGGALINGNIVEADIRNVTTIRYLLSNDTALEHPPSLGGSGTAPLFPNFHFTGTHYRFSSSITPTLPGVQLKTAAELGIAGESNSTTGNVFVVPMNPVTVSEDSTITFTMNIDLTNIIEQYQGADNIADTADDVFILAKDWWEKLSLTVSVD